MANKDYEELNSGGINSDPMPAWAQYLNDLSNPPAAPTGTNPPMSKSAMDSLFPTDPTAGEPNSTSMPSPEDALAGQLPPAQDMPAAPKGKSGGRSPSEEGKAAPSASQSSPKDYLKDLVNKLYGNDLNDDALKNAQGERNRIELLANLGKAGAQVGAAASRTDMKPQTDVQDGILKGADQPIQDILQRRQGKMQEMEAGLKASDLADREKLRDPQSGVSAAYRNMALQLNPKLAQQPDFANMNAEGIKQLMPMVDMSIKMEMLKLQRQTVQGDKQEKLYNKAEVDLGKNVEGLYGPRGSAGRAAIMSQAADRLNAYASQFKDKNKMTPQEVELIVKDLGTMMSGGAATEGSSKRIMPPALSSKFANLVQLVTSNPSGANMGEFVKRMQSASNELKNVSKAYELEHVNALIDSSKSSLRPDYYKNIKAKYAKPASNKVTVSNGTETHVIDMDAHPEDLQAAIKDNFKVVE